MSNTVSKFADILFTLDGQQYANRIPVTGGNSEADIQEEIQNLVASYGTREFDVVYHYSVAVSGDKPNKMDSPLSGTHIRNQS